MLITKIIIIIMIIIIKSYVYYFTLIVFNCYAKDGVEECKDNQKYFTNLS